MPSELLPLQGNINFNAQHSPMGAFMSFTCGHFGSRGGFGLQIGRPGNQDLYIGVKDGDRYSDSPLKCLPFFEGAVREKSAADAFLVEQAGPAEQNVKPKVVPYRADQIRRHYGWATDKWVTEDFEFAIYTPFGAIADPSKTPGDVMRQALCPAVIAELVIHNRSTQTRTGCFAIRFHDSGVRLLDEGFGRPEFGEVGFGLRNHLGILARLENPIAPLPFATCRWSPEDGLRLPVHLLGSCAGIGFEVPPGQTRRLLIAMGVYLDGIVTTRIKGKYLYTNYFGGLNDVLTHALTWWGRDAITAIDEELVGSELSPDQQFLIAHATRSYYGSTQLLDVGGQPFWVVNEGEYCMMNTLDLSVDHVFWELKQNPWVVRNLLDNFLRHYSYHDEVKGPGKAAAARRHEGTEARSGGEGKEATSATSALLARPSSPTSSLRASVPPSLPGGISFCHDMGVHNNFSPFTHSSYELPNLTGCFSYMTAEQSCNWSLIAATYVINTSDMEWAKQNVHTLSACVSSLVNRGGESGFVQFDSSRCGESGAEITTYDSLDHSLAQTRNNVYMAVKCWASYMGLAIVLEKLHHPHATVARERMTRIENVLSRQAGADGVFPAVFEKDNPGYASRILPAAEGLMYPLAWGVVPQGSALIAALKRHTLALLLDPQRRNLFADGGIKLSSTSNNSWMSKIAIFQHIARKVLHLDEDPKIKELFANADAAHVKWQTEGSAYWACCDQIVSGVAQGSKYYPRIITTALWMRGNDE